MNKSFLKDKQKGQGLVEYTLIAVLVAIPLTALLMSFGSEIETMFTNTTSTVTGGAEVHDGVLYIPNLSPSYEPNPTSNPTNATPTPTIVVALPTNTPYPTNTPTATVPACTPGSATNITSRSECKNLRDSNNCEDFSYNSKKDKCTWY